MQKGLSVHIADAVVGHGQEKEVNLGVLGAVFLGGDHKRGSAIFVFAVGVRMGQEGFDDVDVSVLRGGL